MAESLRPLDADELFDQERSLTFASFTHDDAWSLGCRIVELARERAQSVVVHVVFAEQVIFHAALAGTSRDNDHWVERKLAVARRFDSSSLRQAVRFREWGLATPEGQRALGLDPSTYALSGGAVPIRVATSTIGYAVVSGLTDDGDHDLVVEGLHTLMARRSD